MAVIHVFKDGTTTTELKDVYVPQEIVKKLASLKEAQIRMKEKEKKNNGSEVNYGRQGNSR